LCVKENYKTVLLDASGSPSMLFDTAVETVVEKYREAKAQSASFKKYVPCRVQALPKSSGSSPCTTSQRSRGKRHHVGNKKGKERKDWSDWA